MASAGDVVDPAGANQTLDPVSVGFDGAFEGVVNEALAEIVGGFCRDMGDQLDACLTHLSSQQYQSARQEVTDAEAALDGLRRFVRQFRAERCAGLQPITGPDVEATIRAMCSSLLRGQAIDLNVRTAGLSKDLVVPARLLWYIVVPLVADAIEGISSEAPANGRVVVAVSAHPEGVIEVVVEDNGSARRPGTPGTDESSPGGRPDAKGPRSAYGLQVVYRLVSRIGGSMHVGESAFGGAFVKVTVDGTHFPLHVPHVLHEKLSPRELQVLQMISLGMTVSQISKDLSLSQKTVSTYRARVLEKMEMRTTVELMRYGILNRIAAQDARGGRRAAS